MGREFSCILHRAEQPKQQASTHQFFIDMVHRTEVYLSVDRVLCAGSVTCKYFHSTNLEALFVKLYAAAHTSLLGGSHLPFCSRNCRVIKQWPLLSNIK